MPDEPLNGPEKDITLFAKAEKIFPRSVSGHFRRLKWLIMSVCLAVYYLAPFIRWDRGANAPNQAILIDLPSRRAYWFGIEIWPQEVYYLVGVLVLAAILLFFVTSLFGRVWCGYLCFQTVWTDLFILVEQSVQGDRGERKRLSEGPWTFEKVWKLGLTHLLWIVVALFTAGAFVLYFNDAPTLIRDLIDFNASTTVLGFMGGLTFSTYLMAGFAREQVCTYMCPYARFQSGMFDPDTLIIGYDEQRGEPRGHLRKGESFEGRGDCIDCSACVQVCPMGIDIRNGLQIQCIACGLCIDACNTIMDKIGRPRGLVRYDTERRVLAQKEGKKETFRFVRPRTVYYAIIVSLILGVLAYGQITRKPAELHVIHDRNPLFVRLSDGTIHNGYDIKILNRAHAGQRFSLHIEGLKEAALDVRGAGSPGAGALEVAPDSVGLYHVFVKAPAQDMPRTTVRFLLKNEATGFTAERESLFISEGAN